MRKFTPEEDSFLKANYLTMPCKRMAKMLGRTEGTARQRLKLLGITVPPEVVERFRRESLFKPGQTPPNKGKKMPKEVYEKVKRTMFKPGSVPHNSKYDGHERVTVDGYIEVRVSLGKYVPKHRKIWEEHNGSIPEGMLITFKDNNPLNCTIENLEMITRGENAIRNKFLPGYPRELQKAHFTLTQIQKKLKNGKK